MVSDWQALLINQGDWIAALFNSPLAIGLFVAAVVLTYLSIRLQVMEKVASAASEMVEEEEEASETAS